MRKTIILLSLLLFLTLPHLASAQGFLHTSNKLIVDGNGKEVILRGMGLGGWMLQEGYMMQVYKDGTQHSIKQRITDLIGKENCDRFYYQWLHNDIKKSDVDSLARWGFNSIRLPMHYLLYSLPIEQEPVKGKNTWLNEGFALTDSLLKWCSINKIYLILDLHAAPGGQGKDANISDYDPEKPSVWESDGNKQKTIALWEKLAERYVKEPWIGGYDLINEPNWTWEGKHKNGIQDTLNAAIWSLYKDITTAIRKIDRNHIIFIEGNGWGNNYRGLPGIWDSNMAISFHKYWNENNQGSIGQFIQMRDRYNVPLWLGESGENSNQWFADCIRLMEQNHIGWLWWTLKKPGSFVCPLHVKIPKGYPLLTKYWNEGGTAPSREVAMNALFQLTENIKAENCFFVKDYVDAMFRQVKDTATLPYKKHVIPGIISSVDYDLGQQGYAYCDSDYQNVPGTKGRWNKGNVYRNDGVDIQKDAEGGYYVFSTQNGEWLKYTIEISKTATYKIVIHAAAEKEAGLVKLFMDNKEIAAVNIPVTGGNEKFIEVMAGKSKLGAGRHEFKVLIVKGGVNLDNFQFLQDR